MNELDQITDESHDRETDRDSLGNLNKLYVPKLHQWLLWYGNKHSAETFSRGFCASNEELWRS